MPITKQATTVRKPTTIAHKLTTREALMELLDALEERRVKRCRYCLLTEKEIRQLEKIETLSTSHSLEDVYFHRDIQGAIKEAKVSLKR